MKRKKSSIKSSHGSKMLEDRFDQGKSVVEHFDLSRAKLVEPIQRVNIDFPGWVVTELDREANRRNISRQALVKHWIIDHLDHLRKERES